MSAVFEVGGHVPSAPGGFVFTNTGGGDAFDFFISTTGNNSNPGTLAQPWSITALNTQQSAYAGKRLGIVAGTYDVSGDMVVANVTVFCINGGPNSSNPTYIASCDTSGNYSMGAATMDVKGASGIYGGVSGSTCYPFGFGSGGGGTGGPIPANYGNATIDGIQFTGFGYSCFNVGSIGGNNTVVSSNITIQNCTFHDSNNSQTTTHSAVIIGYDYQNLLITNCWFNNCISPAADQNHFSGINLDGQKSRSIDATISFCTFTNTPGIYGIVDQGLQTGTTVNNCCIDLTELNINFFQGSALKGLTNNVLPTSQAPSSFHHNIVIGGDSFFFAIFSGSPAATNYSFYNNSWDLHGAQVYGLFGAIENTGLSQLFTCYNNLCWDNGASLQGAANSGYVVSNVDAFSVLDYNIYGTLNQFDTYAASGGAIIGKTSFAGWKTATGQDAHSSTNSTNPFTNGGILALQYQVEPGSPAYQAGRIGGVSSGSVCNVGAWDGTVTQIGCSFAT